MRWVVRCGPAHSLDQAGGGKPDRNCVAQQGMHDDVCCARPLRYPSSVTDPREQLLAATRRYQRTEADHAEARQQVIEAALAALRANIGPTEVERLSPFTAAYIRRLAREQGIPPAAPGPKRPPNSA
jgi:hypothetical protein